MPSKAKTIGKTCGKIKKLTKYRKKLNAAVVTQCPPRDEGD